MNQPFLKYVFFFILLTLVLCGCEIEPRQPTVTFTEQGCTYTGPERIPAQFTIMYIVEDAVTYGAILEVFSIDSSHDLSDLASMPASHPMPEWVTRLAYDFAMEPGNYSKNIDLTNNAAWDGEPVYLVCFSSEVANALNAFGPLEVTR